MGTRDGLTYPEKTCVNCGETKKVSRFPKRGGPSYERLPALDPKRYDSQCKRCKKPAMPGQSREDVKEPIEVKRSVGTKRGYAKNRKPGKPGRPRKKNKLVPAAYKAKVRKETRIESLRYLASNGCEECGERDPRKLEYDHIDPSTKGKTISRLIIDGSSWTSPRMREEVEKCRVLCANCHRVHTVEQQNYYADPEIKRTLRSLARRYKFTIRRG